MPNASDVFQQLSATLDKIDAYLMDPYEQERDQQALDRASAMEVFLTSYRLKEQSGVRRTKDTPASIRTKSGPNSTLDELIRALEGMDERLDRPNFDSFARPLIQQVTQMNAQLDQAKRAAGQRVSMGTLFDEGIKERNR